MQRLTNEGLPGDTLYEVLLAAVQQAKADAVSFTFNGTAFIVQQDEPFDAAKARAEAAFGFPIRTRAGLAEDANVRLDAMHREQAAAIAQADVLTEAQLRVADVPWMETPERLTAYITMLVERPHDYGTCVYAMSMAAVAAFRYVAHALGVTGFQASCADLDILRRTRPIERFMIVNAEDLLYPQYDLQAKLDDFIKDSRPWCHDQAIAKLADPANAVAHPSVRAHWQALAKE